MLFFMNLPQIKHNLHINGDIGSIIYRLSCIHTFRALSTDMKAMINQLCDTCSPYHYRSGTNQCRLISPPIRIDCNFRAKVFICMLRSHVKRFGEIDKGPCDYCRENTFNYRYTCRYHEGYDQIPKVTTFDIRVGKHLFDIAITHVNDDIMVHVE